MKLFICEKPSQGRDIAAVLGCNTKGNGHLHGNGQTVTWGFGHLIAMADPDHYDKEYKKWEMAHLPIIPGEWKYTTPKSNSKQLKVVKDLIKKADSIVIATDADREGEAIAREILEMVNYSGPLQRLWLAALDEKSIKQALDKIKDGSETENLYYAALGRGRADWLVGMNMTRAYTLNQTGQGVLSVGRVQTPTLNLVVERDRKIENFKPEKYFTISGEFSNDQAKFKANLQFKDEVKNNEGYCVDKSLAESLIAKVAGKDATIASYKDELKKTAPPLLFDLSGLQKELSKKYGIGAKETLDIAQSLYETHKLTTYPRTDCPYLPKNQFSEAGQVLATVAENIKDYASLESQLDVNLKSKAWNDKKITAHHAIIPTLHNGDISNLSDKELKAYKLIVERYLAQFLPPYEYKQVTIAISAEDETFKTTGKTPQKQGWKAIFANMDDEEKTENESDQALPVLSEGDLVKVSDCKLSEKMTSPPKRFTEGTLIDAMKSVGRSVTDPAIKKILKETSGIGTEATRATVLETLFKRGYIVNEGKKNIISTDIGRALIDALPDEIKKPEVTAIWEQALDQIATGERNLSDFMDKQKIWINTMIEDVKSRTTKIKTADEHPCPECGKNLIRRKGKKGFFWGCSGYPECKTTLQDKKGKPIKITKK